MLEVGRRRGSQTGMDPKRRWGRGEGGMNRGPDPSREKEVSGVIFRSGFLFSVSRAESAGNIRC